MFMFDVRRVLFSVVAVTLCFSVSTALAQGRGGHGNSGHGNSGHGNSGHGHVSNGHSNHGHGSHLGGGFSSGVYGGHYSHRYPSSGFSLSIGGGYPYGFGGMSYRGLGGYGYSSYGYPYSNFYSSSRSFSPYYSNRLSTGLGYYTIPSYGYVPSGTYDTGSYDSGYRYGTSPSAGYGVPGYASEFSHQPSLAPTYSGAISEASSDLRPGMILPDGSKVISVGPVGAPVQGIETEQEESREEGLEQDVDVEQQEATSL